MKESVLELLKCGLVSGRPIPDCVPFQHASQRCCDDRKLRRKTLVKTSKTEEDQDVLDALWNGSLCDDSKLFRLGQNSICVDEKSTELNFLGSKGTHFSFSVELLTSD